MLTLDTLSRTIKAARTEKDLSQSDLSARADVSRAQIDRLENGRAGDVRFSTLMRILRALDLDLTLGPQNQGRPTLTELRRED
jgi:transcriptional regulator with XRE-family HTH domain